MGHHKQNKSIIQLKSGCKLETNIKCLKALIIFKKKEYMLDFPKILLLKYKTYNLKFKHKPKLYI